MANWHAYTNPILGKSWCKLKLLATPSEHEKIVNEIRSLRSQVRKSHQQLEPFVKALAEMLDGINIMDVVSSAKDKFMSDTT